MEFDLKALARGVAYSVHRAKQGMRRNGVINQVWAKDLKQRCLQGIHSGLLDHLPPDVAIRFVETPYNSTVIGRGDGINELNVQLWKRDSPLSTITMLADIVDGCWNAAAGVPWSVSTMVSFTLPEADPRPVEDLNLADFQCGVVIPFVAGTIIPHEEPGFFYGIAGAPPVFHGFDCGTELPLHPTNVTDIRQARFFLDLFTDQRYESLSISIAAVTPIMQQWADLARFYGAGIELMSLLGPPGTTPGFGAYIAANQKADNLIPTKMLLEGAGLIVTSWWGEPIDSMKIMDRMYIAVAANQTLHDHLISHLSRTVRLP